MPSVFFSILKSWISIWLLKRKNSYKRNCDLISLFISYQEVFKHWLCHSPLGNPEYICLHSYTEKCNWQVCATKSLKKCLNGHMWITTIDANQRIDNHDSPSLLKCWISATQNATVFYYRDVKSFHTLFQTYNLYFRQGYQGGKSIQLSRTPDSLICTVI